MIDEICSKKEVYGPIVAAAFFILEYWLGKTNKTKSGSTLELFVSTIGKIIPIKKGGYMEKPFDKAALAEKLKAQGLPLAEDLAEKLALCFFEWTEESLAIHPNPIVKTIGQGAVAALKPLALQEIDKIDGLPG